MFLWQRKAATAAPSGVSVNSATLEELTAIKGVGRVLAEQIIAGRPWGSLDALTGIRGVSANSVQQWGLTL